MRPAGRTRCSVSVRPPRSGVSRLVQRNTTAVRIMLEWHPTPHGSSSGRRAGKGLTVRCGHRTQTTASGRPCSVVNCVLRVPRTPATPPEQPDYLVRDRPTESNRARPAPGDGFAPAAQVRGCPCSGPTHPSGPAPGGATSCHSCRHRPAGCRRRRRPDAGTGLRPPATHSAPGRRVRRAPATATSRRCTSRASWRCGRSARRPLRRRLQDHPPQPDGDGRARRARHHLFTGGPGAGHPGPRGAAAASTCATGSPPLSRDQQLDLRCGRRRHPRGHVPRDAVRRAGRHGGAQRPAGPGGRRGRPGPASPPIGEAWAATRGRLLRLVGLAAARPVRSAWCSSDGPGRGRGAGRLRGRDRAPGLAVGVPLLLLAVVAVRLRAGALLPARRRRRWSSSGSGSFAALRRAGALSRRPVLAAARHHAAHRPGGRRGRRGDQRCR